MLKYAVSMVVGIALWLWFYGIDDRIHRWAIAKRRSQIANCLTSSRYDFFIPLFQYGLTGAKREFEEPFNILFDDFLKYEIERFFKVDESSFTSKQAKMSENQYFALCFSGYLLKIEHKQTVCDREMYTVAGTMKKEESYEEKLCVFTGFGISALKIALASVHYANDIFPDEAYYPSVEERLLKEIESGSFTITVWNEPFIP